jgi:transposase
MAKHSELTVEQRQEAVLSAIRREEALAVIARRYGVSEPTLTRWRDEFLAAGRSALVAGGNGLDAKTRRIGELEDMVSERERVIGELTIANRVLKKMGDRGA